MKKVFKIISKFVLILVIFGFLQPVACNMKGFQLAETLLKYEQPNYTVAALGLYLTFFAAVISLVCAIVILLSKHKISDEREKKIDSGLFVVGIAGIIITFICIISEFNFDALNYGSYLIISGWILSLIFRIIGKDNS
jgi:ABC-type Fe3+ transport system permease subunit